MRVSMLLSVFSADQDERRASENREADPACRIAARRLDAADIEAMARVYRSRGKLMLRAKERKQRRYPEHFARMLSGGCEAYGSFLGAELRAFCIVSPWSDMPFFAFLLIQCLPVPGGVNMHRNGLSYCMDAALASLEARGYTHMVYQRVDDPRWRKDEFLKTSPGMSRYLYTTVESIPAGARSKWRLFDDRILFKRPASHDVLIIVGARSEAA